MPRRVDCPHPEYEDAWLELPDEWLGVHAMKRDEVVSKLSEGVTATQANFTIAVSLLDDWRIPHINGNPEAWDVAQMPLKLIAWVTNTTLNDFNDCFRVKKNPENGSGLGG